MMETVILSITGKKADIDVLHQLVMRTSHHLGMPVPDGIPINVIIRILSGENNAEGVITRLSRWGSRWEKCHHLSIRIEHSPDGASALRDVVKSIFPETRSMLICARRSEKAPRMKKIRIDRYQFLTRKGKAYVLLQPMEECDMFCIPWHYVGEGETIKNCEHWEDDGDFVINEISFNESRISRKDPRWILLSRLPDIPILRNESYHILHNILRFFLFLYPRHGETGLRQYANDMLEQVRIAIAKKNYIDELQKALDNGGHHLIREASVTPPDPELVKKEIVTLEHFKLYTPNRIPMNELDGECRRTDAYTYCPIDWGLFGCKEEIE